MSDRRREHAARAPRARHLLDPHHHGRRRQRAPGAARAGFPAIQSRSAHGGPRVERIDVSAAVFAFAFLVTLAAGFGLAALLLAAIGIYGVLSYSVSRRTREMGIRVALGATPRGVAQLVVREGLAMTGIGVAIGLAAALALSRFLRSLLYEVRPADPVTYAAVAVTLMTVAVLATWLPARRASSLDPITAPRLE